MYVYVYVYVFVFVFVCALFNSVQGHHSISGVMWLFIIPSVPFHIPTYAPFSEHFCFLLSY